MFMHVAYFYPESNISFLEAVSSLWSKQDAKKRENIFDRNKTKLKTYANISDMSD